jgi:hypothetical protein
VDAADPLVAKCANEIPQKYEQRSSENRKNIVHPGDSYQALAHTSSVAEGCERHGDPHQATVARIVDGYAIAQRG